MRNILPLIVLVPISLQGARADVRQDVDLLVAALPTFAEVSTAYNMGIPESGPVGSLLHMGMDAVPFLVPHLANMNMTQSFRVHGSGRREQISVNEFVGHIITRSCGHYFYVASGERVVEYLGNKPIKSPETIALYQEQVRTWHDHVGHWKESDRKLVDIEDWFHYNRFKAYEFFAKNPSPTARPRLRARMQLLLTDLEHNSTTVSELVSCSETIASIGDVTDLDLLKQIWLDHFERPMGTSGREDDIKRLYQSRVKLRDKVQAKKDIDSYNLKYSGRFPPIIVE